MAEYRLTPAAEHDLEKIWLHTLEQWSAEQANRYLDLLTAAFVRLAHFPTLAPACDAIRPGYRRQSIGRHMIYFRITDYGIVVIRILHHRMDASRYL